MSLRALKLLKQTYDDSLSGQGSQLQGIDVGNKACLHQRDREYICLRAGV